MLMYLNKHFLRKPYRTWVRSLVIELHKLEAAMCSSSQHSEREGVSESNRDGWNEAIRNMELP